MTISVFHCISDAFFDGNYNRNLFSLHSQDIKAVLDSFKRYDSVHEKYKKHKSALKKLKEKSPEKDASVLEKQLEESRHLLLVLCKVILLQQTPASWHHRITHYNQAVRCYAQTVTMTPTM